MHDSRYHKVLRVGLLVTTMLLVFDGGFLVPFSKQISDHTIQYLASSATGVFVGVPPNEINQLTAELTLRERELDQREAALQGREISTRDFDSGGTTDYSTYILSIILFILTSLIVLNYALDWMRVRKLPYEEQTS